MKNGVNPKFKYLIPAILLVFLLIPQPAFAFIDALFGFLDHMTEAIEESQFAMFLFVFGTFLLYLVGVVGLVITTWLLQFCLENQTVWLTSLNIMTQVGWSFVAGIANMLVVLILLIIAFAFILKIETFQAQKALPRLIIVALLINFSWLFVKMFIDLTQIIYATILAAGGGDLLGTAFAPFFGGIKDVVAETFIWLGALITSLMVPIASTWSSLIFAALFLGIFLPNILVWIFKTFCFFTLSGIFLTFALLFAARVFVLQMLAMLSPIAFLALILPQTKSHWDDWLKHLTSWLLLGVFLLFFLVLGFTSLGYIIPEGLFGFWTSPVPIPGLALLDIAKYIFYYFAIFVYMVVLLFISKKYLPELASFLIGTAASAAGFVMTRGLKPLGQIMKIHGAQTLAASPTIQKWAERVTTAEAPPAGQKLGISRLGWAVKRGVGRKVGPDIREFQTRRRHEARKKAVEMGSQAQLAWFQVAPEDIKLGVYEGIGIAENIEDIEDIMAERHPEGKFAKAKQRAKEAEEKEAEIRRENYDTDEEYREAKEKARKEVREAKDEYLKEKDTTFDLTVLYALANALRERGIFRAIEPRAAADFIANELMKKGMPEEEAREKAWNTVISAIKPEHYPYMPITSIKMDEEFMEHFTEKAKAPIIDAFFRRFRITGEEVFEKTLMNLALEESLAKEKVIPVSEVFKKINPEAFDYFQSMIGWGLINLPDLDEKIEKEAKKMGIKLKEEIKEEVEEEVKKKRSEKPLKEILEEIEKRKEKPTE